jgi:tetratricopeptide (TPR) repeat protein
VHAVEASPHPEKGLAAAERLKSLMPAAGHLLHMPAHIMQRLGRYEDAAEANRQGSIADEAYTEHTQPLDYYPVVYTAHNFQFLAYSAAMAGRKAETIAAVDRSRQAASDRMLLEMPGMDWYVAESYAARVRFGLWNEILALPRPNPKLAGLMGGYLYGRAVALTATGRLQEGRSTLKELKQLAETVPVDAAAGQNTIRAVLAVAIPIVEARIAVVEQRPNDAVSQLRRAVTAEDQLAYDEPDDWFFPTRHLLGAELLRMGRASEAERVYREDLAQFPANGWSLYGLGVSLRAQGRVDEALRVEKQLEQAWSLSDIKLTASAY